MTAPCQPHPDAAVSAARAAQARLGAAIRASTLPGGARLLLWTTADLAAEAADAGRKFSISIVELAEQSGLQAAEVMRLVSRLFEQGWMTRTADGQWLPAAPAPRAGA